MRLSGTLSVIIAAADAKERYGIEVLVKKSSATCSPASPTANDYPEHYQFYHDFTGNYEDAIAKCQALNQNQSDNWNLVIFNNNAEMFKTRDVIINDCWGEQYFRLGLYTDDTTVFGKRPDWVPAITENTGIPGNECVFMGIDGVRATFKAGNCNDPVGIICENHNFFEACTNPPPVSNPAKYRTFPNAGLTWAVARQQCINLGEGWDLAVPDDEQELNYLTGLTMCNRDSWWVGVKWIPDDPDPQMKYANAPGEFVTVRDTVDPFIRWDLHTNFNYPNPNTGGSLNGATECMKLRGNSLLDAGCNKKLGRGPYDEEWGYICEYEKPAWCDDSDTPAIANDESASNHYRWHPPTKATPVDFFTARKTCQQYGGDWDIAIINNRVEYDFLKDTIAESDCWNKQQWWFGHKKFNDDIRTIFGKIPDWKLQWDDNEPGDDPQNVKQCVRMLDGKFNDVVCDDGFGNSALMGFVCENHNFYESCEVNKLGKSLLSDLSNRLFAMNSDTVNSLSTAESGKYSVVFNAGVNQADAQAGCQAKGAGWELAVPNTKAEFREMVDLADCHDGQLWIGLRMNGDKVEALNGDKDIYVSWDEHTHFQDPSPNGHKDHKDLCINIRGDLMDDIDCAFTETRNKHRLNPFPMSYICEYTEPPPVTTEETTTIAPKVDECLPCKHNNNILPWAVRSGCLEPTCGAKLGIVDAWQFSVKKKANYGFVGKIKVPEEVIDSGKAFSVLIRFPKKVTRGNFQLWNMKFWNFYNGGFEVLLHSKWWNTDRHDPYSVAFVAENLNADDYPELLFWEYREKRHQCFDQNMHHGQLSNVGHLGTMRSGGSAGGSIDYQKFLEVDNTDPENVVQVKFKNGKMKAIKKTRNGRGGR